MVEPRNGEIQVVDSGDFGRWPTRLIINGFVCTPIRVQRIAGVYLVRTLLGLFALRRDGVGWDVEEVEGLETLFHRG
ncbi:MAG: hypothetical protein FJ044_00630 [Candidatus Cloacimonetes bacterium]|nr:hypothetical protein [Candidatus Cloacimonadota bacterium]